MNHQSLPMKTFFVTLIWLTISLTAVGQAKWPYLDEAPRYVAAYGSFTGRNLEYKEIGIAINMLHTVASSRAGTPLVGPQFTYRTMAGVTAVTAGLFIKGGLLLGTEYQYRWTDSESYSSIKPAIGVHVFHLDFEYGYNIYLRKVDRSIPNGEFRIGLAIPLFRLSKKK